MTTDWAGLVRKATPEQRIRPSAHGIRVRRRLRNRPGKVLGRPVKSEIM